MSIKLKSKQNFASSQFPIVLLEDFFLEANIIYGGLALSSSDSWKWPNISLSTPAYA